MTGIEEQPSRCFGNISCMWCVPFLRHDTRLVLLDDLDIRRLVGLCIKGIQIPETSILAVTEEMVTDPVEGFVA